MFKKHRNAHLQWLKMAEEAIKRRDYETAARFYKYVSVHFGLQNNSEKLKAFTVKTGECYLKAAENLWSSNKPLESLLFLIKASNCFADGEDKQKARKCDLIIKSRYELIRKNGTIERCNDAYKLKRIGDYFINHDFEKAIECYEAAAEKAFNSGKLNLSGSIYGTLGECYMAVKRYGDAAERYARSAEIYNQCREYFEAAWRYCISGFHFILSGDPKKALDMAVKAELACEKDEINVLLNDLASVCRLLSEGRLNEALRRWRKIRNKFKKSYAEIVDSCFYLMTSR